MRRAVMMAVIFLFVVGMCCAVYCQDTSSLDTQVGEEVESEQTSSQEELGSIDRAMDTDPSSPGTI